MKGIVFTEFMEMVESNFGYEMVEEIIEASDLPSGGIYTAVGTYEHNEMVQLVSQLSKKLDKPVPNLLNAYGQYLFNTFHANYTDFFTREQEAFSFLESIDKHIHVEVQKLYSDAQLPKFECKRIGEDTLEMVYSSKRKMSDFALGLIERTLVFYETPAKIEREFIEEDGSVVKFIIKKQ